MFGRHASRNVSRTAVVAGLVLSALTLSGCDNALRGGAAGGALGALAGLGIGSLTGDMGKGAVIGGIVGAGTGAVIGDQNRRRSSDY